MLFFFLLNARFSFWLLSLLPKHDDAAIPLAQLSYIGPPNLVEPKSRIEPIRPPQANQPDLAPSHFLPITLLLVLLLLLIRIGHVQALIHEQAAQPVALAGRMHGQRAEVPPLLGRLICEQGLFDGREAAVKGGGCVEVDGGEELGLKGDEVAHYGGGPGDCGGVLVCCFISDISLTAS